jgi:acetylornithine deacetylase/succinyl-diaminopimelate desuccinylase-like protein
MLPNDIRDYLLARRDEQLAGLFRVLRYPSISSQHVHQADCLACADHLAGELRGLGFSAGLRPWRNHPVMLARWDGAGSGAPTVLIYGHYDVQPPDPLELWASPPFEPTVRNGAIFARGADDDKGQLYAHIKAVEAFMKVRGRLPVNVIFFAEGEEEIGSPELERFIVENAADLRCDCAVISDSEFFARGLPSITNSLRGLAYVELTLTGPARDLHSGLHGGAAVNPLNAIARMVAALHDDNGRITLDGFYDDVLPATDAQRQAWRKLPFDERAYAADLGAEPAGGERGLDLLERRWARPTLDCHGIVGGYVGEGSKTVIPSSASAKISMRLVANQDPKKVVESFRRFVETHTPAGVRADLAVHTDARPVSLATDSPAMTAARAALKEAFGAEAAFVPNGASVPIAELFQRVLKVDPILMGFGLPDDNLHSPNEKFDLGQFHGGMLASAALLENLAKLKLEKA